MRWKLAGTVCALFAFVGLAMGDTFNAFITKVEDGKVTFKKITGFKDKKPETGESMTLPAASNVKVFKGKGFDMETKKIIAGDALEGGIKSEMFKKAPEKGPGRFATITTDADNKKITEVIVFTFGKKGKKGQ